MTFVITFMTRHILNVVTFMTFVILTGSCAKKLKLHIRFCFAFTSRIGHLQAGIYSNMKSESYTRTQQPRQRARARVPGLVDKTIDGWDESHKTSVIAIYRVILLVYLECEYEKETSDVIGRILASTLDYAHSCGTTAAGVASDMGKALGEIGVQIKYVAVTCKSHSDFFSFVCVFPLLFFCRREIH